MRSLFRSRLEAQLVQCIGRVRDELPQKRVLVGVDGVDQQLQEIGVPQPETPAARRVQTCDSIPQIDLRWIPPRRIPTCRRLSGQPYTEPPWTGPTSPAVLPLTGPANSASNPSNLAFCARSEFGLDVRLLEICDNSKICQFLQVANFDADDRSPPVSVGAFLANSIFVNGPWRHAVGMAHTYLVAGLPNLFEMELSTFRPHRACRRV